MRARVAIAALAIVALVAACGGDDTEASAGADTAESTSLPAGTPTCDGASGENTDLDTKPTVDVPAEPVDALSCQDLVVGDGDEVLSADDTVTVHYVGVSQSTGEEFDASWGGEPISFPLAQLIAGWVAGIPGMKVGGRRVLTIPGDLAYGPEGRPPAIGPNDTLVFVIDLIGVGEPEPEAATFGTGECAPDTKPAARPDSFADAPMACLTEGVDYSATVVTSEGTFTIDLLEDDAPVTVNNFVELTKWGWFDGDDFHRVVPGFVNQAGDPVGNPPGTGDPGYAFGDELPDGLDAYVPGAVAMANSGPNTNGSQWFTCIDCSVLPTPAYTIFGQVDDGMDVVEAINALGAGDGPPSRPVTITEITITES